MTDNRPQSETAILGNPDQRDSDRVRSFLKSHGIADSHWYAPADRDDLDRAVRRQKVSRVVCISSSDLFEGVWNDEIVLHEWFERGVELEFVLDKGAAATCSEIYRSWRAFHERTRRRRAVAGAMLSVVAIVAAFVLIRIA